MESSSRESPSRACRKVVDSAAIDVLLYSINVEREVVLAHTRL